MMAERGGKKGSAPRSSEIVRESPLSQFLIAERVRVPGNSRGGGQELEINVHLLCSSFPPPSPPDRVQRVNGCCYGNRGKPQASEANVETRWLNGNNNNLAAGF